MRLPGAAFKGQEDPDPELQDPEDRKPRRWSLLARRHWAMAPWSCTAMIQEKADKDISSVGFFLNPESRENARSGIKAPKRARREK